MKRLSAAIIIFLTGCLAGAQIPVGAWRDHISYIRTTHVAVAGDIVYASAGAGITVYNKDDRSLSKLSRVHGLSDVDISSMRWAEEKGVLVIGYANGNVDLVAENRIINIPDIMRSNVAGSKRINNITIAGSLAYLSCNFGAVVLDLDRHEIRDTYFFGGAGARLSINDMEFDGEFIYAATSSGLYRASVDAPNLLDFSYWENLSFLPGNTRIYLSVALFEGSLYAVSMSRPGNYQCFRITGESFEQFGSPSSTPLGVRVSGGHLAMFNNDRLFLYGQGNTLVREIDDYGYWGLAVRDVEVDSEGEIWVADRSHGLIRVRGDNFRILVPPGPYSNRVFSIKSYPGRTYITAGGRDAAHTNLWQRGEYTFFSEESYSFNIDWDIHDILFVKEHPSDPEIKYVASWGYGLTEYREGNLYARYNEGNSTLRSIIPGDNFIRIGGMAFDKDNNLWVTNSGVPDLVSVLRNDGSWLSFPYGGITNHSQAGRIIINRHGHKWMLLPRGGGLFVFDADPYSEDRSADLYRRLSIVDEDNRRISNEVFSIAEDHNGNIWVGTNIGVVVYYIPERVFDEGSFPARRIVVEGARDEERGYLLNNETVTAIAVDGANRKWFGTEKSGAFLVSSDGRDQIYHFTTSNSPLLSNSVTDISVDPASGEVFIGTSAGTVSFRGKATESPGSFRDVYAFPNPVRESYDGPVTITGLVKNSIVKITDISGNLIYETVSLGGQAVWDGLNVRGQRVSTGIYLIFVSSPDGMQSHVTKLMFIH